MKRILIKYSAFVCFTLVFIICGCGIKGNPATASVMKDKDRMIQNMKALSSSDGVILKWDIYKGDSSINYVAIEKSEVGTEGNECKDCPRTYEKIAQVPVKEIQQTNEQYNNFSFIDKNVVKDRVYNYRLMLCNKRNICSERSTAEINFN